MKRTLFFILLLLLTKGCVKDQINTSSEPNNNIRITGLQPDDQSKIDKVPLLVSKNFLKTEKTTDVNLTLRGKPVKDLISPTVNITSPINGDVVKSTVNITVTATDNVGVVSVELRINNVTLSILTTSPYTFNWNTSNIASGSYKITAIAKDKSNNTATHTINVIKEGIVIDPTIDTAITYEMKTPPVGNQGSEGSCVAWSVGYAARSIDWYYKNNQSTFDYSVNIFSPEFLYNQIKFTSDCNSGSAMQTALDFIKSNGIPTWSVMPYTSGDCSILPTSNQSLSAQQYKITEYYKIYTTDTSMIKSMVRQNKPVIISVNIDSEFVNAKYGFIWKYNGTSGSIGHSVVIVGYSESLKAWKIMNSFGSSWGTNGFAYMEYQLFPTRTGTWCYVINY